MMFARNIAAKRKGKGELETSQTKAKQKGDLLAELKPQRKRKQARKRKVSKDWLYLQQSFAEEEVH